MQPASLFLSQLRAGGAIDSRTRTREEDIDQLAASIHTLGLLQPLVVRSDLGSTQHEIVAGNRRFAAIQLLHSRGDWPADKLVDVRIASIGDTAAAMASMAENFTRTDLHPVEEFEAFARLKTEYDMADEAIAQSYGIPVREVQQRLALGGTLCREVREAWFNEEIDEKAAMVFTLEPDHAKQAELLAKLSEGPYASVQAWQVRQALKVDGDDSTKLRFVGREAYVAAGGELVEDLFSNDGDARVLSPDILDQLVRAKMDEERQKLLALGWSWVKNAADVENTYLYPHAPGERREDETVTARLAEIDARLTELEEKDTLTDEEDAEGDRLNEERDELQERQFVVAYTPEVMATAGCFLQFSRQGFSIIYGRVEPKGVEAARKAVETRTEATEKKKKAGGIALSNALAQSLSEQRTIAISRTIATQPQIALAAAIASMTCEPSTPPLRFRTDGHHVVSSSKIGRAKWATLFAQLVQLDVAALAEKFAEIAAQSVNVVVFNSEAKVDGADALVDALPSDIYVEKAIEAFDFERYFAGISGEGRAAALKAMGSDKTATGKKTDQVEICVAEAKRIGWLPRELAVPKARDVKPPKPAKAGKSSTPKKGK